MLSDEKAKVIHEVQPIRELLAEVHSRLQEIPRSSVAARQLSVIIAKLEVWHKTYGPTEHHEPVGHPQNVSIMQREFSLTDTDKALTAYKRHGYFGLSDREKAIIQWFDRRYNQQQA